MTSTATMPSPSRENSSNNGLLQRLAVERLKYNVNELQTLVDYDRRMQPLPPPKQATVQLIADHTAFTTSIGEIKNYVNDGAVRITVPFSILDSIDGLKRGSDPENVNARETVRWFDKLFRHGNSEVAAVRMQGKDEIYGTWDECLEWYNPPPTASDMQPTENGFASPLAMTESMMLAQATDMMEQTGISPPKSPTLAATHNLTPSVGSRGSGGDKIAGGIGGIGGGGGGGVKRASTAPMNSNNRPPSPSSPLLRPEVPRRIQPIVNCALFCIHSADASELSKVCDGVTYLVTNNPETSYWAKRFSIPVLNTKELAHKVRDEARLYKEKKREYDILQQNRNHNNNTHGGGNRRDSENRRSGSGRNSNEGGGGSGGRARHGHSFSEGNRRGLKLDDHPPSLPIVGGGSPTSNNNPHHGGGGNSGRRRNRSNQNANFSTSPRSGGGGGGGGRGGGGITLATRGGHHGSYGRSHTVGSAPNEMLFEKSNSFPLSPTSGGGYRARDGAGEPEYVLGRDANRGVARGRGKLWVP